MSKYYKEGNFESTRKLFNKGFVYKGLATSPADNNVVDFNFGEKTFYGRIRRDSTPIVPAGPSVLKSIRSSNPDGSSPRAMNFVADIFDEMALQFQKCAQLNKISSTDPFLSNLIAYQGYINPSALYDDYRNVIFSMVEKYFINNNINVKTFEDLNYRFQDMAPYLIRTTRLTYPGFVKSRDCPILCSGLAIEIATEQDFTNDDEKVKQFINSKNWEFFVNTCDTYGFMIDYNIPWRIVADIDSEIMRQSAARYGYMNPNDVLARAYKAAAPDYLGNQMRLDLFNLYNRLKAEYWAEARTCSDGSIIQIPQSSRDYTWDEFKGKFGFKFFLELYLWLRLYEERPELSTEQQRRIVVDITTLSKSSATKAIAIFEKTINKEFDKVGSFGYIRDSIQLQEEELFRQGKLGGLQVTDDISSY